MPARSNAYQKVVYFIQKHIDQDATVTESAMVVDKVTGRRREVDVLVEGTFGGHPIVIGIEVRDHTRKADVQWIDQMQGKYRTLPVDKVALVSRLGFTRHALAKAEFDGIEAVTPSEGVGDNGPLAALRVEAKMANIEWRQMSEGRAWVDDLDVPLAVQSITALYASDGLEVTSVGKYSQEAMTSERGNDVLWTAEAGERKFGITLTNPMMIHPRTGADPVEAYLRTQEDGVLHRLDRLDLVWEVTLTVEPVPLEHGAFAGSPFAFGKVDTTLIVIQPSDPPDIVEG